MNRLLITLCFFLISPLAGWAQIYVSVQGSDTAQGTRTRPLASVAMALRKAREMRRLNDPSLKGGIEIIVGDGLYRFSEPLFIRPEDSGTEESPTLIKAAPGTHPVFSGGLAITGWKKLSAPVAGLPFASRGKVWVAPVPLMEGGAISFRQLWVNGKKAIRARDRDEEHLSRILSWDHRSQTCWIPKPTGMDLSKSQGMEMVIHQWWAIAVLRIRSMETAGDSVRLHFFQPESRIQSEHPWPAPWISTKTGNSAFYLTNALQFLDEPGEWYLDQAAKKIYYYPRSNEDLRSAKVIAPCLETIVRMEGTIDHPVSHVFFQGISFQHAGWLRPSRSGHVPLQAGMYLLDAYKLKVPGTPRKKGLENQAWIGRPAAAVEVQYARQTGFTNCRFEHLASTGLDYRRGTSEDQVTGNLFKDIGGSGILIGTFSDEAQETHLPFLPGDEREICTHEYIANNLITDVTNEDWGCVGLGAGYVRGIRIEHNEIRDVCYTGISLGWGWTKEDNAMKDNRVVANRISHYARHMYDVAGIYTLSSQPGTLISDNAIDSIYKAPYAHDPDHWFYLYTDEGSSYITVRNNWCPSQKFLQNANGPGNSWENNGPRVNDSVRRLAGLQPGYRQLLSERTTTPGWPVQYQNADSGNGAQNRYGAGSHPVVVELVTKERQPESIDAILSAFKENGMAEKDLYRWKNHVAGFSSVSDTSRLKKQLVLRFPGSVVKIYRQPFYVFDRSRCGDTRTAADWDNILLTADLVPDPKRQREYLDYHATQFNKWPEVSRGFCQADFQQLLVYKNGRQLMLVISIPRGKTLDELNPRTTENNPRVDEWNRIMKKYQVGIRGTKPGEVWVVLNKINGN